MTDFLLKPIAILFCASFLHGATLASPAESSTTGRVNASFSPCAGTQVSATISKLALVYSIVTDDAPPRTVELALDLETEPLLLVEDFNFDGHPDLSFSHLDEGKGTYMIHRIFVFDPASITFEEARPSCGDGFINVTVDRHNRLLTSTVFHENRPKLCKTTLGQRGKAALRGRKDCSSKR